MTERTYKVAGEQLPCELTVTNGTTTFTYTIEKLTDDELELNSAKGTLMAFERAKP